MIISRFKSNHPFMIFTLLILALGLWTDGFLFYSLIAHPTEEIAPLYNLMAGFFNRFAGISVILSFLFLLLQAVMINRIITGKNLVDRNSWLPALMYITLMSSSFSLFGMQPVWFANFFLIIALDRMFEMYNDEVINIEIFNVAFLISLASLFYLPAIFFIFFVFATLILYYLLSVREILAALIGMVLPYLFLAIYYYWTDVLEQKIQQMISINIDISAFYYDLTPYKMVFLSVMGLISLVAVLRVYLGSVPDKPVRIRKRYHVVLANLVIAVLSFSIALQTFEIHYAVVMLPLSAIFAGFFQENKRKMVNEVIFTLLIFIIVLGKVIRL
jgi:hypothetical protein